MRRLSPAQFGQVFDSFAHTAVRVETLQRYTVEAEAESIQAWREGWPRRERSPRTSPWLRRIQETTTAGKTWARYRVVEHPLSEYVRYELTSYPANQAAGEHIWIVDRDATDADLTCDWWGFDLDSPAPFVVLMRYDPEGRPLKHELTSDPHIVRACRAELGRVGAHAVPLDEYLTSTETR